MTLIEILVGIVVLAILAALSDPRPAHWRGPYVRKEVPLDPWERPCLFTSPGTVNPWGYDLLTYGEDGKPGGTGEDRDITAWEQRGAGVCVRRRGRGGTAAARQPGGRGRGRAALRSRLRKERTLIPPDTAPRPKR